ncbi:hypothetical protein WCD93_24830 [Klebsiella michiganensis]|uniref:hypothetical protein n=1 Tax=Klebsiella TaxID=570 RepID=UPI00292D739B|nr:hypothetical protein [Klebsiella grimontii]
MNNMKRLLATLATPDRIMDILVSNRWDTKDNPAEKTATDSYFFDRSGTLKINPNNRDVQDALFYNINALSSKKKNKG